MGRILMVAAALALASGPYDAAAQTPKQMKAARKLVAKLKLVDGVGSGLDADTLQGLAPSAFLPAGAKATDADTLDGFDSSAFVKTSDVPTVGHFSCAGTASFPIASTETYDTNSSERYATGGLAIFRCNLALPDGAAVTALSCTVKDADASNGIVCEMWRTSATNGLEDNMATTPATGDAATPGVTQLATSTITDATIDNTGYSYFVQARDFGSNSNIGLYGFNVTYSISPAATAAPIANEAPAPSSGSSTD